MFAACVAVPHRRLSDDCSWCSAHRDALAVVQRIVVALRACGQSECKCFVVARAHSFKVSHSTSTLRVPMSVRLRGCGRSAKEAESIDVYDATSYTETLHDQGLAACSVVALHGAQATKHVHATHEGHHTHGTCSDRRGITPQGETPVRSWPSAQAACRACNAVRGNDKVVTAASACTT